MSTNEEMVSALLSSGIIGKELAGCMLRWPRARFLPPSMEDIAYSDIPIPLMDNQTTSAPSMVGIMLMHARIGKGMKVLEIGTGPGWQTALLSCLVGSRGRVYSMEISEKIHSFAKRKLGRIKNITLVRGDGTLGYKRAAPYDCIIVSAAASAVYPGLASQLREGGTMIIPLRGTPFQALCRFTKVNGELAREEICPVLFVPMQEAP